MTGNVTAETQHAEDRVTCVIWCHSDDVKEDPQSTVGDPEVSEQLPESWQDDVLTAETWGDVTTTLHFTVINTGPCTVYLCTCVLVDINNVAALIVTFYVVIGIT